MTVRISWVRAMKCVCAQTRPRFILSSERDFFGNGVRTHVNSKGKIPSTGKFPQRRIEPATLHYAGQRAQTLPTSYSDPLQNVHYLQQMLLYSHWSCSAPLPCCGSRCRSVHPMNNTPPPPARYPGNTSDDKISPPLSPSPPQPSSSSSSPTFPHCSWQRRSVCTMNRTLSCHAHCTGNTCNNKAIITIISTTTITIIIIITTSQISSSHHQHHKNHFHHQPPPHHTHYPGNININTSNNNNNHYHSHHQSPWDNRTGWLGVKH